MKRALAIAILLVVLVGAVPAAAAPIQFGAANRYPSHGNNAFGLTVARTDFSGRDQVVVANLGSSNVAIFTADGHGGLGYTATATPAAGLGAVYTAAFQISPTSAADLAVADNQSAQISYLNPTSGGGVQVLSDQSAGNNPNQIVAGDFDGNTREDLAVANFGSNSVSIYSDTIGGIPFTPVTGISAVTAPIGLATADLNGDGDLDLIIGAQGGIVTALGGAGTTFGPPITAAASPGQNRDLAVADFNGDGDPDVVAASDTSPGVRVFFGGAGATLSDPFTTAFGNTAYGVGVGDLNGDGIPDILSVDTIGQIQAIASNGDGTFAAARSVAADLGATYKDIVTLDLDGDGDLDAVYSNNAAPGEVITAENLAQPAPTVAPATLAFAGQPATTAGPVAAVTVSNADGARPLQPSSVSITGGDDFLVASDDCAGATVPRGGACRVGVRFAPASPGDKSATLRIATDAAGGALTVPLSGPGLDAPVGAPGRDFTRLVLALFERKLRARAGKPVKVALAVTLPAALTLDVLKKTKRVAHVTGRARKAGRAKIVWSGNAKPGRYTLRVQALSDDGQLATQKLRARLVKRRRAR